MLLTTVTETPKGCNLKYKYDETEEVFKLKKMLSAGMYFPFDFGFIPRTKGEDGDPLDVLILSEFGTFPGCHIQCRLIGGIKASQTGKDKKTVRNDRFLVVPVASVLFQKTGSVAGLPGKLLPELQQFFVQYNALEGKIFKPLGTMDVKACSKVITAATRLPGKKEKK